MTITFWLPLLVCVIGLVVYALASNPKAQRLAWWAYAVGLIVTVATCVSVPWWPLHLR